jgi:hypothetical protein
LRLLWLDPCALSTGQSEQITQATFFSILCGPYDTMSKATTRVHLTVSAAFAECSGASFHHTALPDK